MNAKARKKPLAGHVHDPEKELNCEFDGYIFWKISEDALFHIYLQNILFDITYLN